MSDGEEPSTSCSASTLVPPGSGELDWCRPFLCKGTVEIEGTNYPVTVLRDTAAQQSLCRNVTGREVTSSKAVLCRGINTVDEFVTAEVKLSCPLVTTSAQVAVADDLPVVGVDFLLGNDLAGGKVWAPTPTVVEVPDESGKVGPEAISVVTRAQARRVAEAAVPPVADRDRAGPPVLEDSIAKLVELEPGSPVSQGVGANRDSAGPPAVTPDSEGVVAEGEDGMLSLSELFDGYPHPAGHLGGDPSAGLSPGLGAEGPGTQSRPQPVVSGSQLEVAAKGGEASSSAGEVEVSPPSEDVGGRDSAVPLRVQTFYWTHSIWRPKRRGLGRPPVSDAA